MKKILLSMILLFGIFTLCACGKNTEEVVEENSNTVAGILASNFKTIAYEETNTFDIATKLSTNEVIKVKLNVEELNQESYIEGFNTEIKNFKSGAVLKPMISTIPFIAYVFEVDNPENFSNELKENANLRWNICTTADEMKTIFIDKYVFFVMSPNSFDE